VGPPGFEPGTNRL